MYVSGLSLTLLGPALGETLMDRHSYNLDLSQQHHDACPVGQLLTVYNLINFAPGSYIRTVLYKLNNLSGDYLVITAFMNWAA
jgi:hypothetical protein